MENLINSQQSNRKVTLSCRVLPEQKLLIAERAKAMGMSLAQYVEAKVLQKDKLELEKIIQRQQLELEKLKEETQKYIQLNKVSKQELEQVQNEFDSKFLEREKQSNSSIKLKFKDEYDKELFLDKLRQLAKKHKLKSLQTTLKSCLEYTFTNDNSMFFLETVKGFFQKRNKKIFSNSNK